MSGSAFQEFVLKIHSRCNLACDHCYVYEAVDQSWRGQPMTMSTSTVRAVAGRIAEHAAAHGLAAVRVVLHGGEPLMVGPIGVRRIVRELRAAMPAGTELGVGVQTNGVLVDRRFAELLLAEGIRVGVSLDGGRTANDRHRRYAHGGSSYDQVVAAVGLLSAPRFEPVFAGLLCTVDPANDPVQVFHDLAALRPPRIDLLLPHATWAGPPPAARADRPVYGDWLVEFFDAWYDAPPTVGVRLFEEVMNALLGGASRSEAVGLSVPDSIVIETDGSFERTDALKVAYAGAPATGYSVLEHSLDDVLRHPAVAAGRIGPAGLAQQCRDCPIVSACGGGLYPHRYREDNGFDNPSVYCRDLTRLIEHVRDRLVLDLNPRADLACQS